MLFEQKLNVVWVLTPWKADNCNTFIFNEQQTHEQPSYSEHGFCFAHSSSKKSHPNTQSIRACSQRRCSFQLSLESIINYRSPTLSLHRCCHPTHPYVHLSLSCTVGSDYQRSIVEKRWSGDKYCGGGGNNNFTCGVGKHDETHVQKSLRCGFM